LSGFISFADTEIREALLQYKGSVLDGVTDMIIKDQWLYKCTQKLNSI
jgi:hypothetical protein